MPKRLGAYRSLVGSDEAIGGFVGRRTAAAAARVMARVAWCVHKQNMAAFLALRQTEHAALLTLFQSIKEDGKRQDVISRFSALAYRGKVLSTVLKRLVQRTNEYVELRNTLAHWLWYGCQKRPNLLILLPQLQVTAQWVRGMRVGATWRRYNRRGKLTDPKATAALKRANAIVIPDDSLVYDSRELEEIADHAQNLVLGWIGFLQTVRRGNPKHGRKMTAHTHEMLRRRVEAIPAPPPLQERT
jgi:hypothetical protein